MIALRFSQMNNFLKIDTFFFSYNLLLEDNGNYILPITYNIVNARRTVYRNNIIGINTPVDCNRVTIVWRL